MDFNHALHGHPRSMSCEFASAPSAARESESHSSSLETAIASTVMPADFLAVSLTDAPSDGLHGCSDSLPEASIPLPPSPPGPEGHDENVLDPGQTEGSEEAWKDDEDGPVAGPNARIPEAQMEKERGETPPSGQVNVTEERPYVTTSGHESSGRTTTWISPEEGPGLRTLGIPSDEMEGQETPTQDVSQSFPLSLDSVLDIFRHSHHEAKRCSALRREAYTQLYRYGHRKKLIPTLAHRHRQLVRCHREDFADEFTSMYAEIPSIDSLQTELRRSSVSSVSSDEPTEQDPSKGRSWMSRLSTSSSRSLVRLLDDIRTDDNFLAERITRLPSVYLDHLSRLHVHRGIDSAHTVRPFGVKNNSRPPSRLSAMSETFENLDGVQRDPLQVMIHSIFDWSAGSESVEGFRRERIWAKVCSKLINQDVNGAERMIIAILEEFSQVDSWKLAPQFETLLLGWIQSGVFILDPDIAPNHRGEPEEVRKSRLAVEQTRFLENALSQFLSLLTENIDDAIPLSCLNLIRSALTDIEEAKRNRAKQLFFSAWFCQSYLQNTLICPERHGLLNKQHIRREVRSKLLKGVYIRLANTFEASRTGHPAASDYVSQTSIHQARLLSDLMEARRIVPDTAINTKVGFLSLASDEMLSVLATLFPHSEKSPDPSGHSIFGRAFSLSSSTAGGSRATTVGSLTPMFGTTSSAAPSTSSTSITSDTFFSENPSGFDSVSVGISEDTTAVFTSNSSTAASDDSQYIQVAQEIRCIMGAFEQKKQSVAEGVESNKSVSILFLNQGKLSLQEPDSVSDKARELSTTESSTAADNSNHDWQSVHDILRSSLSDMANDIAISMAAPVSAPSVIAAVAAYLSDKVYKSQADYEFVASLRWHKSATIFSETSVECLQTMLQAMVSKMDRERNISETLCNAYEDWMVNLRLANSVFGERIRDIVSSCNSLRDKQWFGSVVCHSSEYRDTMNVTRALATMATGKAAKQGGLAGWAKRKLKVSFGSEKAQAQALAMLSASKQQGGPCKLTDSQSELTANWILNNSIENFCGGEERIHRFCYEIQRCTKRLVADTMIASPVLWSSNLYEREKKGFGGLQGQKSWSFATASPTPGQGSSSSSSSPSLAPTNASRIFPFSLSPPHSRQVSGTKDFANSHLQQARPSILDSSIRFSTPPENALGLQAPWPLPPSPVSPNVSNSTAQLSPRQRKFLEDLRQTITSLLLSDLSLSLWTSGCETDYWINEERLHHESIRVKIGSPSHPDLTQLAQSPTDKPSEFSQDILYRSKETEEDLPKQGDVDGETKGLPSRFPYEDAYDKLLTRFRLSPDPFQKLDALYELIRLIAAAPGTPIDVSRSEADSLATKLRSQYASGLPDRSIPRTGLTKLQEVVTNCEERRIQSLTLTPLPRAPVSHQTSFPTGLNRLATAAGGEWLGDPNITNMIQALLLDRVFYPTTLFRDLQMISAFIPSSFLDASPQGAAFWTVGLAAMQLKSALCSAMIDRAAQITNFHVDRGNKGREPTRQDPSDINGVFKASHQEAAATTAERYRAASPNRNYQSRSLSEVELRTTSLADAGRLFRIAALEGDPAAARELGLFYLTHPEHVRRTLRPLSRPSEVAKMAGGAPAALERNEKKSQTNGVGKPGLDRLGVQGSHGATDDEMNIDVPEIPPDGRDPGNLATAWHWMETAADSGDVQAKNFLLNNSELNLDV